MGVFVGNDSRELTLYVSFGLKILSEGNTGDQKKLRLVSLAIYVGNCYLMNILDGRLYWKWFKGIFSVCPPWP